ncbi:MAG: ACR3 family arsenite efflux transporter [Kiritimatiellae bacterium]|nr:ACR3 family arsenite efflux transporter [Kiritimatiellia bacterium]
MKRQSAISFFDRYLSVWVALCMALGAAAGKFLPSVPAALGRLEIAHVSLPVAVLIWLMIFPMMLKVDFASIRNVGREPRGLFVTWAVNWLIKPFTMFAFAWVFFRVAFRAWIPSGLAGDYLAGAVLLGAAPCTAMVFVWSQLTRGDAAYTVVQVATNDLIILAAFAPIVKFLLGVGGVEVPWGTLLASVALFVVVPLALGVFVRRAVVRRRGEEFFRERFLPKFSPLTMGGLLATLVLIFAFQGSVIFENPLHIALIAVPLVLQTFFIFFLTRFVCRRLGLPHAVTAPAAMIGASNFFELSVAVAVSLFGATSPVALATVVGVLVEVPVMLTLVAIMNRDS